VLNLPTLFGAFQPPSPHDGPVTIQYVSKQILLSGFRGQKAPSRIGKLSTAEVLRLRATSAVSGDKSVRRCAQDDESVGEPEEKPQVPFDFAPLRMTILWGFDEKHPEQVSAYGSVHPLSPYQGGSGWTEPSTRATNPVSFAGVLFNETITVFIILNCGGRDYLYVAEASLPAFEFLQRRVEVSRVKIGPHTLGEQKFCVGAFPQ
jgi:hypothetical protein